MDYNNNPTLVSKAYSTNNLILPYCIYHKINKNFKDKEGVIGSSLYLSHIGSPELIIDKGGVNPRYKCMDKSLLYSDWIPYATFYSLNPLYRPIPKDMVLICAAWKRGEPYNTLDIIHVMDPYKIESDLLDFSGGCMYFYAFSRKIKGTIPLYFFKNNDGIYATFENNPPDNNENWIKSKISVLYVISPDNVNNANKEILLKDIVNNIKFNIDNDTCIYDKNGKYSISECLLNTFGHKEVSLLDQIKNDSKYKPIKLLNYNFLKYLPIYFIIISVSIFTVYIYIIIKNRYSKNI